MTSSTEAARIALRALEIAGDQSRDIRGSANILGDVAAGYAQLATAEAIGQLTRAVAQLEFAVREELERIDDALRNTIGGRS